jgi:hypothetical protein
MRFIFSVIRTGGLSILALFCGCGIYSFSGSNLPAHIKTVTIPFFQNQTSEFGVDQELTNSLIAAVNKDNTLKIGNPRSSDSALMGAVVSFEERAGQYDRQETKASNFRIFITIKVRFEDVKKKEAIWEETWTQWGEYESNRNDGISQAVEKLTTEVMNRLVSGW